MTQEHTKRAVLVMQNDQGYGQRRAYTDEDEAWRSFLENPLTAATKAMMSVNGDDDSAAALGLLYDYYKVPRDRRSMGAKTEALACDADQSKRNHMVPFQEVATAMTDSRLQVPRSCVFSAVAPGDQPCRDKRDPSFPLPDTTVTVSIAATAPSYVAKAERGAPPPPNLYPAAHCSQQDLHGLPSDGHLKHRPFGSAAAPPHAPDSTFSGAFKDGCQEVLSYPGDLRLHMGSAMPNESSPFHTASSHSFEYSLEALKSLRLKSGGGPMTYLNKSQFYPISFRQLGNGKVHPTSRARSVVMLVFGEEKSRDDQLKHWRYWHSRQHTAKQRCIDIADYKGSFDTITNIEETAYNAISFTWDTSEEARIYVSVNCLSTDFSSQKGVKGLPLSLQIDTYSAGGGGRPVHRSCCQIKVFCDKGAERKVRDEERKQSRRKGKCSDTGANLAAFADGRGHVLNKSFDVTTFKDIEDLDTQPVLFVPDIYSSGLHRHPHPSDGEEGLGMKRLLFSTDDEFGPPPSKVARTDRSRRVLLYVRKETEEVFDALMLNTPTLTSLVEAISEKYQVPLEKFGKVYKRSKKGILVNMDDNIVQHYSNEDTFQIHLEELGGVYKLTLTEI